MNKPSISTDCFLLPEMVDDAMGQVENAIHHFQEAMAVAREIADGALAGRVAEHLKRLNRPQLSRGNRAGR